MRTAHFHEDHYREIELLPLTNWEFCVEELEKIKAFDEEHRSDVGWTDIYIRDHQRAPLAEAGISLAAWQDALSATLSPFDRVTTGYSDYVQVIDKACAFGPDENLIFFADYEQPDTLTNAWTSLYLLTPEAADLARTACESLAGRWDLFLVDWGWSFMTRLDDTQRLDAYLSERVRVFSERFRTMSVKPVMRERVERKRKKPWWQFW